jgi:hypothetical protein
MMYRPDTRWHYALALDADNQDSFWYLLDERAAWFYESWFAYFRLYEPTETFFGKKLATR